MKTQTEMVQIYGKLEQTIERFNQTYNLDELDALLADFHRRDRSDGADINELYTLKRGAEKIELHYLLVPVDPGMPFDHNFWLSLAVAGKVTMRRDWNMFEKVAEPTV